jgi:hypothetical protein
MGALKKRCKHSIEGRTRRGGSGLFQHTQESPTRQKKSNPMSASGADTLVRASGRRMRGCSTRPWWSVVAKSRRAQEGGFTARTHTLKRWDAAR